MKTKHVKKIRGDKALKKKIADVLADFHVYFMKDVFDVKEVLLHGHRGYLSMTEKELCALMDHRRNQLANFETFKQLASKVKMSYSTPDPNDVRNVLLQQIEEIQGEIFEKICLN